MPPHEGEKRPYDSRPVFVIPYWPAAPGDDGDTGKQRPLPASAAWYMCKGIHASPYQPGTDLEVTVDVRNFGGSNAPSLAQVTVWWSDPTTGFVVDPSRLIGFRMVAVPPRGGQATTALMVKKIPATAPNHICLIARVSHQYDRAGDLVDPMNNKNWAQRNLAVLPAAREIPAMLEFIAGNPLAESAEFNLHVSPLEDATGLVGVVQGELLDRIAVFTVDGEHEFEGSGIFSVALETGEQRPVRLSIRVDEVDSEHFAAFAVKQLLGDYQVGGLGIVITAEDA
jgi:hypothetical protein